MFKFIFLLFISLSIKAQSVYKTPSGAKFHMATCRMVNNVSKEISITEALAAGLMPCKICNPPAKASSSPLPQGAPSGERTTVQCKGITKKGERCKHKTSIANGFCFQHNPD